MTEPLTLPELRCFIAVSEERHYGRAAAALGISQPAVSQAIARLQDRLGIPLVARDGRGITLTAAGETLYVRTGGLVADLDRAVAETRRAGAGEPVSLVLAVAESLLHAIAATAVASALRRAPRARVSLRELSPEQQVTSVRTGSVDAGLLYLPVSDPTGLAVEILRAEAPLVALPRGHPLAKHRRLRLEHLHQHRAVSVERAQHPALHDLAAAHVAEHGVRLDVVQEVSGKQAVLALVAAGVGLAIVPEGVRGLPVRGITYRPLVTPGLELQIGVVWRADRRSAPLLALVAALRRAAG